MNALHRTLAAVFAAALLSGCTSNGDLASALRAYNYDEATIERIQERIAAAIRDGADPNVEADGVTALDIAIRYQNSELVRALIAAGANIDARPDEYDGYLTPPLIEALDGEEFTPTKIDIVRALVDAGADVNAVKASEYDPPIFYAVRLGSIEAVTMLFAAGARCQRDVDDSFSALTVAAENGNGELLRFMLQREDCLKLVDNALSAAPCSSSLEVYRLLMAAGPKSPDVTEMLACAVIGVSPDLAGTIMTDHGVPKKIDGICRLAYDAWIQGDNEQRDKHGELMLTLKPVLANCPSAVLEKSLFAAVQHAHLDAIKDLLPRVDVATLRDKRRQTPLMTLVRAGAKDLGAHLSDENDGTTVTDPQTETIANLLLANKVNIDAVDEQGHTALMLAARELNEPMVRALLTHGADRSIRDQKGLDALDIAKASRPRMPGKKDRAGRAMVALFGFDKLIKRRQTVADRIVAQLSADASIAATAEEQHE